MRNFGVYNKNGRNAFRSAEKKIARTGARLDPWRLETATVIIARLGKRTQPPPAAFPEVRPPRSLPTLRRRRPRPRIRRRRN